MPQYISKWMGGPIVADPGGGTMPARVEPPQQWIKQGQGSRGEDAARFLVAPPAISLVELNSRVGALARERGLDPCHLTREQRKLLVDEVMAAVPQPPAPQPAKPEPLSATEQHAVDLMEQAHAAAGGTREYSEGTPGIGAARLDYPRHGR